MWERWAADSPWMIMITWYIFPKSYLYMDNSNICIDKNMKKISYPQFICPYHWLPLVFDDSHDLSIGIKSLWKAANSLSYLDDWWVEKWYFYYFLHEFLGIVTKWGKIQNHDIISIFAKIKKTSGQSNVFYSSKAVRSFNDCWFRHFFDCLLAKVLFLIKWIGLEILSRSTKPLLVSQLKPIKYCRRAFYTVLPSSGAHEVRKFFISDLVVHGLVRFIEAINISIL